MIEANVPTTETATKMATPMTITTSMILLDLENGIDRPGIRTKYDLEAWELTEMFKHPVLKGKKASRKRKMSFSFVDDTTAEVLEAAPNQIDLEDSIVDVAAAVDFNNVSEDDMEVDGEEDHRNQFEGEEAEEIAAYSEGFDS
jgi:hypothetical protein